jgi:hypothetical protein
MSSKAKKQKQKKQKKKQNGLVLELVCRNSYKTWANKEIATLGHSE